MNSLAIVSGVGKCSIRNRRILWAGILKEEDVRRIVPDGDSERRITIDVLLTSHHWQRQECQGIGLKRVRHGPRARGDAKSESPSGESFYTGLEIRHNPTYQKSEA